MKFDLKFDFQILTTNTKKEIEEYQKVGAITAEVFSSIRTVIAFNGQKKECKRLKIFISKFHNFIFFNFEKKIFRYFETLDFARRLGIRRNLLISLNSAAMYVIMFSSYGLAFW